MIWDSFFSYYLVEFEHRSRIYEPEGRLGNSIEIILNLGNLHYFAIIRIKLGI